MWRTNTELTKAPIDADVRIVMDGGGRWWEHCAQRASVAVSRGGLGRLRKERVMEPCWKVMACGRPDCIMFGRTDNKCCWDVEGTLCSHHTIRIRSAKVGEKREYTCACANCFYYEAAKKMDVERA